MTYEKYLVSENTSNVFDEDEKKRSEQIEQITSKINAPYVKGADSKWFHSDPQLFFHISLDDKKDWNNGIFHNSRYMIFRIGESIEQTSMDYKLKVKFRKTKAKSVENVIKKINEYIKKVS